MAIVKESICIIATKICIDATDGKVHLCHFPSSWIRVLSVHGNIVNISTVILNKFCTLDEHTARTAAGIYQDAIFDTKKKALSGVEVPKRAKIKGFPQIFGLLEALFLY